MDFKDFLMQKKNLYILILISLSVIPLVLRSPYWYRIFMIAFYYVILALSWDLIMGYTGQFSWGQQVFSALAAYTSSILVVRYNLPLLLSVFLAITVSSLSGLLIGIIVFRMRGFYLCLTTWVLGETLTVILMVEQHITGGTKGMFTPLFTGNLILLFYLGLGLIAVSVFSLERIVRSRIGLYLRSIKDDEDAAEIIGVDTFKWKTSAFTISGLFGGLAGVYYAHTQGLIAPSISSSIEMGYLVTMVVIGGMGTLIGPFIGAIIITILLEYMRGVLQELSLLIFAIVVMVLMRSLRGGLVEAAQKIKAKYLKI